jgi:hypothetical protein
MSPAQVFIALLFVCTGVFQLHAQQVEVLIRRVDALRSVPPVLAHLREDLHFQRRDTIELHFKLAAVIDSISTLSGKRFEVIAGPWRRRDDSLINGVHDFSEMRVYRIKPRKRGRLVVPAMTVYSVGIAYRSEPLELVIER